MSTGGGGSEARLAEFLRNWFAAQPTELLAEIEDDPLIFVETVRNNELCRLSALSEGTGEPRFRLRAALAARRPTVIGLVAAISLSGKERFDGGGASETHNDSGSDEVVLVFTADRSRMDSSVAPIARRRSGFVTIGPWKQLDRIESPLVDALRQAVQR